MNRAHDMEKITNEIFSYRNFELVRNPNFRSHIWD